MKNRGKIMKKIVYKKGIYQVIQIDQGLTVYNTRYKGYTYFPQLIEEYKIRILKV